MPGCARRVRPAYSRTLCLPCLKAGIFCFLHYRYRPLYVQLFILNFLCICLCVTRTSFFSFSSFKRSSGGFLPLPSKPPQGPHRSNRAFGAPWCRSPTRPQNRTQGHTGASRFFPQNELTPPPKGGGAGFNFGLFSLLLVHNGPHGSNGAGLGSCWCPSPYPVP